MKTEFRNRAFLPVVIPLAILLGLALLVGLFAVILLWNTRETAVMVAIVAAAGILVATALAASQDRLDASKKLAIGLAGGVPVILGALIAAGVLGNIPDEARLINVEPHTAAFQLPEVPPDAPILGATSLNSFCEIQPDGSCVDSYTWTISLEEAGPLFTYAFDNMDEGVDHNLTLFELEGDPSDPEGADAGDLLTPEVPEPFPGVEARAYEFEWPEGTAPENFYYLCTVHPSTMFGVATIEG